MSHTCLYSQPYKSRHTVHEYNVIIKLVTFRVSRRRREMYCGHAHSVCLSVCVSVCLSAAACPHYCTDTDVTWGRGRGCPCCALLDGFAIDALVALLWQHYGKCAAEPSGNPPGPPHAARMPHTHYSACRRRLPSPAIKSTRRSISSILLLSISELWLIESYR